MLVATKGIVYVAWGKEHIDEAVKWSQFGNDYPKVLFTNEPVSGFNGEVIVRDLPVTRNIYMRRWYAIKWSPFDITCMLDTDSVLHGSIQLGFDLAEEYGYSNKIAPGMTFVYGPDHKEYVHYQGAIHFWRRGFLDEFFDRMLEFTENNDEASDETAIAVVLRRLKINPAALPDSFCMVRCGRVHDRRIRVCHSYYAQFNTIKSDGFGNDYLTWEPENVGG